MVLADPRHERHHAPDLLRGVDDVAVPGAHAADVDDLGALLHDLVDALLRRPVVVGRSPVVERVRVRLTIAIISVASGPNV